MSELEDLLKRYANQPGEQKVRAALHQHLQSLSPTALQEAVQQLRSTAGSPAPGPSKGTPVAGVDAEPVPGTNWAGNISLEGARAADRPQSTTQLIEALEAARAGAVAPERRNVRPLGTTHSSSFIVQTEGTIVDTGALLPTDPKPPYDPTRSVSALRPALYRLPEDRISYYMRVGSGIRISELIEALDSMQPKRAMAMLGAYTGQTFVGATCTGTHGTGIDQPALHQFIHSFQLVGTDAAGVVTEYRVEPSDGITDAAAYGQAFPKVKLVQDDQSFRALQVSLGSMGVITSVVVEVVDAFYLKSETLPKPWSEVRAALADTSPDGYPTLFAGTYSAGVLMNPYPWLLVPEGPRKASVNRSWLADPKQEVPLDAAAASHPHLLELLFDVLRDLVNNPLLRPLTPLLISEAVIPKQASTKVGPSAAILASSGNLPKGYSVEYAWPLHDYLPGLDAILDRMRDLALHEDQYILGSLSIRYVKADDAYLSMAQGQPTVFTEFLTLAGIDSAQRVFTEIETVALAHGARPHWGQYFDPGKLPDLLSRYPEYSRWKKIYQGFNASGLFDSPFTKALP